MTRVKLELGKLGGDIRRMEEHLRVDEKRLATPVSTVSHWSVLQQLSHTAMVMVNVLAFVAELADGKGTELKGGPTMKGWIVLGLGRIPRGKAKSPERYQPAPSPTVGEVGSLLAEAKKRLTALALRQAEIQAATGRMPHPFIGNFTAKQWLRFARIHTDHHLRIVADILRANEAERS
jgi:hypothetical protein